MIILKNSEQIRAMREAGRITGEALLEACEYAREGMSTKQLDDKIRHRIEKSGARPSFLGYDGFPGSACISLNDEVIHGIPSERRIIKDGDIVKIDVGAFYKGYHGDSANTVGIGRIAPEAAALIETTRQSFYEAVAAAEKEGARLGDVGHAVEAYVRSRGCSVVRMFVGHGVGRELHEQPDVPNYGLPGRGVRITRGMTIAIEPMVNLGGGGVRILDDKWTVKTEDGSLSAHYEHTIAVTENGIELLTRV